MKRIAALLFLVLALLLARGQTASTAAPPPLPAGPPIEKRAPELASWIVTEKAGSLDQPDSKEGAPPTPAGMVDKITKTGTKLRDERIAGATTWEIFCLGSEEVLLFPDQKTAAPLARSNNPDSPNPFFVDLKESDFPGFDWIKPEDYTGMTTFNGTKCIVYQEKAEPAGAPATIAYVDLEKRLPVALQKGGYEFLYEWREAPPGKLSFPDPVEDILKKSGKSSGR